MGKRGPKPGFKRAAAVNKAAAAPFTPDNKKQPAATSAQDAPASKAATKKRKAEVIVLSAAHRENPEKLSGEALRTLAHKRGLAKSEVAKMNDAKIREQLRYRAYQQYEDEAA